MKEIRKIKDYLLNGKFRLDYSPVDLDIEYWISPHQEESITIDYSNETVTVSRLFDEDKTFTTLDELKEELYFPITYGKRT